MERKLSISDVHISFGDTSYCQYCWPNSNDCHVRQQTMADIPILHSPYFMTLFPFTLWQILLPVIHILFYQPQDFLLLGLRHIRDTDTIQKQLPHSTGSNIDLRILGHNVHDDCTISKGRQVGCGLNPTIPIVDDLPQLLRNKHHQDSLMMNILFSELFRLA